MNPTSSRSRPDTRTERERFVDTERLASSAAAGDRSAVGDLYDQYVTATYRYALSKVEDHATAQDVCQDVWVTVVTKIGTYRQVDGGSWVAWLFAITRSRVADHYRAGGRRREAITADMLAYADRVDVGVYANPEESVMRADAARHVAAALHVLPESQRDVLVARFWVGLSVADTALLLQTTQGSVKQRQRRAIARLGSALPEHVRNL